MKVKTKKELREENEQLIDILRIIRAQLLGIERGEKPEIRMETIYSLIDAYIPSK